MTAMGVDKMGRLEDMLTTAGHLVVDAEDRHRYLADCAAAVASARAVEDFAVSADAVPDDGIAARVGEVHVAGYEVG